MLQGVIIDTARTARTLQTHYNQHVLTDLTLSLLQDSNWCSPPRPPSPASIRTTPLLQRPAPPTC